MSSNLSQDLQRARIYHVGNDLKEVKNSKFPSVTCMFNPAEYTVSKTNSYKERPNQKGNTAKADFVSVGSQMLELSLIFDTYESGTDVSEVTRKLWKFMQPDEDSTTDENPKGEPVQVAFHWGVFHFVAYITNLRQQFTIFTHQGVPVRAKVNVTFTQYTDPEDYKKTKTNPTSGGGPQEQIRRVVAGDRLDNIAEEIYQDATQWRRIAEHNQLNNPLALRPGQVLRIPIA